MTTMPYPDRLHTQAAIGWIELGNGEEANRELGKLDPSLFDHPDVLVVRWNAYFFAKRWSALKHISARLAALQPLDPNSWLLHACSYYFTGEYENSLEIASLGVQQFPDDWRLHYKLACCAARLGREELLADSLVKTIQLKSDGCANLDSVAEERSTPVSRVSFG